LCWCILCSVELLRSWWFDPFGLTRITDSATNEEQVVSQTQSATDLLKRQELVACSEAV